MKKKDENSYRNIVRGTSFFGGVQMFQVLINLVRGKLVAILLGPAGMGISALFTTSSATIQKFASLGLNLAIVKETASKNNDNESLAVTLTVAKRLLSVTAIAGALICILFSSLLSKITFGDTSMRLQFALLGVVVALSILYTGKLSILQGLQEVKRISKASLVGGLTGLLVGVPLYYFWGDDGIVPAMLALALAMYVFYTYSLSASVKLPSVKFVWKEHRRLIKALIIMGLMLMMNELIASLVQYLINIFIRSKGSDDTVGLYQAANSVTNQYAGMVFAAMAMDYFPRLSKVVSDNAAMRVTVNRQTEIVALIIAPAAALLILTAPVVIRILLTTRFLEITPLMRWMGLGILVRALTFPMGYISFAKGNKKLFFWMEGIFCNLLTLVLSCLLFDFFGLIGLGYAVVADNVICLGVYYFVNRHFYGYGFSRNVLLLVSIAILTGIAVFTASFFENQLLSYSVMGIVTLLSLAWGIIMLKRKAGKDRTINGSSQED